MSWRCRFGLRLPVCVPRAERAAPGAAAAGTGELPEAALVSAVCHQRGSEAVPEADLRKAFSALLMSPEQGAVCSQQRDADCELEESELCSVHELVKEPLDDRSATGNIHKRIHRRIPALLKSSDESHVTFDVDSFTKALDRILGADSEELDSDDLDEEEEFDFSDGDDGDLDAGNQGQEQEVSPGELVGSLKAYMNEMDRELAQTNVGKSFTTQKRGASSDEAATCESAGPDPGAEDAELAPVDVDMNLVANLLESYSAQAGLAGPTSNILQSMGVNLPENTDPTGSGSRAPQ
ncbi:protein ecdysoneless homolog [Prinia subflava]|uniref:protein ecdysoneless homolog n=1 Tax=Prinia subflava TaxID=208062 RepID=UPI002FDF367C